MCSAVLSTIRTLENTTIAPNTDKTYSFVTADTYAASNAVKGRMSVIDKAYTSRTGDVWYRHPSVWESTYRCTQIGIIILTFFMLLTILYEVLES